jgi:REP-associated tyrosine transposase
MARAWRIEFDGALYHILSRGNEQQEIFRDDIDRRLFLETVGEMSDRFEMDAFAYVLMDNHYHILLKTNRSNLSKGMQWLGATYTRRFNLRHARSGHLFQGRFKSIIVQNDAYALRLSCYIHRNPVRAGIVERLIDYRWSSYRTYAYGYKSPPWLSTKLILTQIKSENQHRAYREKVQRYAKEEKRLWEDLRHGMILGTMAFVRSIRSTYMPASPHKEIPQQRKLRNEIDPSDLIGKAARDLGVDVASFKQCRRITKAEKDNRNLLVFLVWKTGILTNEKIGHLFGVSYSSVSHIVKAMKSRLNRDRKLNKTFKHLTSLINGALPK